MTKVRIKQIRSSIDRSLKQKRTLKALGLRKINSSVEHELNDNIRGMIFRISHLVEVEELNGGESAGQSQPKGQPVGVVSEEE